MQKPTIFVGSSTEGLEFARAIRSLLQDEAELTLWNEGFFGVGNVFVDTLITGVGRFDFAVLVLTPDDLVQSRNAESFGPRDNLLFELGLFMGRLGRGRTFIVHQSDVRMKIPSDLAGVTTARYEWPRDDKSHRSAVGAACDSIRQVVRDLGVSDIKTAQHVSEIRARQDSTESRLRTLQMITKGLVTEWEYQKLRGLAGAVPFMVRFHNHMIDELHRLDAIRYVQPKSGYGMTSIRERDGSDQPFDLKQYCEITSEGREYLKLRDELLLSPDASA
jgi:hypothetical protein